MGKEAFRGGIRANLLHLGTNMWNAGKVTKLDFDEATWRAFTDAMPAKGFNMLVVDLGEGVVYPSHPELAVEGSWTPQRLRAELARLRSIGLEVVPKLNFSTTHDAWLGEYERMVSTPTYYRVCSDIIRDVAEMFDRPRLFHLGFDEEGVRHQEKYPISILRQGELWWHDFLFMVGETEKAGSRAWIWADKYWTEPGEFLARMPKSVLQSVWYYDASFDIAELKTHEREELAKEPRRCVNWRRVQSFIDIDRAGFDQVPCGSQWACDANIGNLVAFCGGNISAERLKGYMMAPWVMTVPEKRDTGMRALDLAAAAFAAARTKAN